MHLAAAGQTHVGMKRSQNQDNFLVLPECGVFAVADGMGGHRGGETASLVAIQSIKDSFEAAAKTPKSSPKSIDVAIEEMRSTILNANQNVQNRAKIETQLRGMGTTCTTIWFSGRQVLIGHVGDSRSYLVRSGKIWQLTRDHSLVQEKFRAGLISRAQLKTDSMKNVITRSVGFEPEVEVDLYAFEFHKGDSFLLCSDGLSGMIDDTQIMEIVSQSAFQSDGVSGLETATQRLIDAANANGGDDNVTVVLVRIDP